MAKDEKETREDEMWCPECGAPIKKGFLTCTNCRLKVKMTRKMNQDQQNDPGSGSKKKDKNGTAKKRPSGKGGRNPGKNPLNAAGHPRYWMF